MESICELVVTQPQLVRDLWSHEAARCQSQDAITSEIVSHSYPLFLDVYLFCYPEKPGQLLYFLSVVTDESVIGFRWKHIFDNRFLGIRVWEANILNNCDNIQHEVTRP